MLQSLLHDANWVKLNEAELPILCFGAPGLKYALLAYCTQFGLEMLG
jgi:fructokinase